MRNNEEIGYYPFEGGGIDMEDSDSEYDAASSGVAQNKDEAYVLKQIHNTFRR